MRITGTLVEIAVETSSATYAPTVINSAWAKLGIRRTVSVRVRPSAISAYRLPACNERISESKISEAGTEAHPERASIFTKLHRSDQCNQSHERGQCYKFIATKI